MRRHPKAPSARSGPATSTEQRKRFAIPVLLAAAMALLLFAAAPAWAANEHTADSALSLTGGSGDPGTTHPPKAFASPCGTATDPHGDVYVASSPGSGSGTEGRIDVFNPKGEYLTEVADSHQPCSLAVDAKGNLYATEIGTGKVVLFKPSAYPPTGATTYGAATTVYNLTLECASAAAPAKAIAVDPSNEHLFVSMACRVAEFKSAAEGSGVVQESIGLGIGEAFSGLDVDGGDLFVAGQHEVYVTGVLAGGSASSAADTRVLVFSEAGSLVQTMTGSETPTSGFSYTANAGASLAVDQSDGDVYVNESKGSGHVTQFDATGLFLNCLNEGEGCLSPPSFTAGSLGTDLAVDNSCLKGVAEEPCSATEGYASPNEGEVYVTSGTTLGSSHLYAFKPVYPAVVETTFYKLTAEKVTSTHTGEGTVVSNPAGIECGTACSKASEEYEEGTLVTLTANPAAGSSFVSWTGCVKTVEGTGAKGHTCTVKMSADLTVKAKFVKVEPITAEKDATGNGYGTVTSSPGGVSCGPACNSDTVAFEEGKAVVLKAAPITSTSVFAGWTTCPGTAVGVECKLTASEAMTAVAKFNLIEPIKLTLKKAGFGTGTVTTSPAGISCATSCTESTASYVRHERNKGKKHKHRAKRHLRKGTVNP